MTARWVDSPHFLFSGFLALVVFFFSLPSCAPRRAALYNRTLSLPRSERKEIIKAENSSPEKIEKREARVVQYGVASWYGPDFHGKATSSGEIYDMYELTCAHNGFPLGTMVMVTNLENGRSIELKVNDRGPFVKERIIDLSYTAARILGIWEKGTAPVRVEGLGPLIEPNQPFTLQVGSFIDEENAQKIASLLRSGFEDVYVTTVETPTQKHYRVRIGQFETREQALAAAEKLARFGLKVLVTNR